MASNSTITTFEIRVPDFGQLPDEEIAACIIWFDGAWHPQTKPALAPTAARPRRVF